jgi:hypothetical protein
MYRKHLATLLRFRLTLQRYVRGHLGGCAALRRKLWLNRLVKVQARVRAKNASKAVSWRRYRFTMTTLVLRNWRGFSTRLARFRAVEAQHVLLATKATEIARCVRGKVSRRRRRRRRNDVYVSYAGVCVGGERETEYF